MRYDKKEAKKKIADKNSPEFEKFIVSQIMNSSMPIEIQQWKSSSNNLTKEEENREYINYIIDYSSRYPTLQQDVDMLWSTFLEQNIIKNLEDYIREKKAEILGDSFLHELYKILAKLLAPKTCATEKLRVAELAFKNLKQKESADKGLSEDEQYTLYSKRLGSFF